MADETNVWQSVDGNWNTLGSWSEGHVPLVTERVIFPSGQTQSVTAGLDQSGVPVVLGLLQIDEGYSGDIGGSGSPLIISATKLVHQGSGVLWFEDDVATPHIIIDAPQPTSQVAANIDGTDIGRITCMRGKTVISANITAAPDILECGFAGNLSSDVELVVTAEAPTMPLLLVFGGRVTANSEVTQVIQGAGTLIKELTDIITLYLMGGLCVYNVEDVAATPFNFFTAYVEAGTLDFTRVSKTTGVENLTVYPRGTVLRNEDLVTITNKYELGGRIIGRLATGGGGGPIP